MRTIRLFLAALALCCILPASAPAEFSRLRDLADSEYRIAQKAYRDVVRRYGEHLEGLPDDTRAEACRKVGWALTDNRSEVAMEDPIGERVVQKQINDLTAWGRAMGCP